MYLENINDPSDIKKLNIKQLRALAEELRTEIIKVVSDRGGHLASNLGMVELTLAIHYVFDAPEDKLVFDVGHQCYAHKLLTGRYQGFQKLRGKGGVSGFPQAEESEYDAFTAGHASTAISAALGMARTRDIMGSDYSVVALVGDGALTGGMCYEALNDAGQSGARMIVILNDNAMSISRNVGAMSNYLTGLRQSVTYRAIKRGIRRGLNRIPHVGMPVFRFLEKVRDFLKSLFVDGKFFDALGFAYIGPIDGHDIKHLIRVLRRARDSRDPEPVLIHAVTQKGRGYTPAEEHPDEYHGVAPFLVESGEARKSGGIAMGQVAARQLAELAENDIRICAVTAAMAGGTGLDVFGEAHPQRFFDVGIAEEHAVTMAAGMASQGMKPYVGIYSTFLQRAYDQIAMDVCRNGLPVTFLIDRAGLVGGDGATHQGVFDLSYLRSIPNLVIASPRDVRDLKKLVALSATLDQPMAIRYPKNGEDMGPGIQAQRDFGIGEWELLSSGDVMIFAVGRMVQLAMQATIELMGKGVSAGVADARFIKPMDERLLTEQAAKAKLVVTVEENVLAGGFGEGVLDALSRAGIETPTLCLGVPDRFVSHASTAEQLEACGLTPIKITDSILKRLGELK